MSVDILYDSRFKFLTLFLRSWSDINAIFPFIGDFTLLKETLTVILLRGTGEESSGLPLTCLPCKSQKKGA